VTAVGLTGLVRGSSLSDMNGPAWLQRTTAWLAIAGYALLASGLPLPLGRPAPRGDAVADTRLAAKDRSRPFPCMDKPCGCATAEQCFTNCCCHTPAERLAWAKAHKVESAVLVALERRVAADAAPTEQAGGCCAAKASKKPTCCSAGAGDEKSATPSAPPAPPRLRTVTLQAMLACGGILTQWLAVGGSLPPPPVELSLQSPFVEFCICGDHAADGISAAPALPPPRAA
jgi:hypothetical protein